MSDFNELSKLVSPYSLEMRAKAFYYIFRKKSVQTQEHSQFSFSEEHVIDSLKYGIAAAYFSFTVPENDEAIGDDVANDYKYIELGNDIVTLVNTINKKHTDSNIHRKSDSLSLNMSYSMSKTNGEYISNWQKVEFFESFENTVFQLFGVKHIDKLVKYVCANELPLPQNSKTIYEIFGNDMQFVLFDQIPDLNQEEIKKNSWTLEELKTSIGSVSTFEDVFSKLSEKLLPIIWTTESGFFFLPSTHEIFQITMENMFIHQPQNKLKATQKQFEHYVSSVITAEFQRIDQNKKSYQNYYTVENNVYSEQDLLVFSKKIAWIFEIKASNIDLGVENPKQAMQKLKKTYKSRILKATKQIDRVINDLKHSNNPSTGLFDTKKSKISIPSKIEKFNGLIITVWNHSIVAHKQDDFIDEESNYSLYPVITIFDLQYLLKSLKSPKNYLNLYNYFETRRGNSDNHNIALDFDELNLYDSFINNLKNTISMNKTPNVVYKVDEDNFPRLVKKLTPYSFITWYKNEYMTAENE